MTQNTLHVLEVLAPLIGFGFFLLLFPAREKLVAYLEKRCQRQEDKKWQQDLEILRRGGEERIKKMSGSLAVSNGKEGALSELVSQGAVSLAKK